MTKKIFRSIFLVALAVFLACLVIVLGMFYNDFLDLQQGLLQTETRLAAQGVNNEGAAYFEGLRAGGCRITWIDEDGTVLYDNWAVAANMSNHADRAEVQAALQTGYGESVRTSDTFMENQLYSAQRLADGTVLRLSHTQQTLLAFLLEMWLPILLVLIVALALSLFLASRLSRKIIRPLNELNLDDPLSGDAYGELAPLLTRLTQQQRQIKAQMDALDRRREEFAAVTGSMAESLILLNDKGAILSVNSAAARLFGAEEDCTGKDMLTLNRSLPMQELLRKVFEGERNTITLELSGGKYELTASPVVSDGAVVGAVLLAFDITEKAGAEQLRREFTANVSHELKTPLHTISGCAEIIQNGLVKQEDLPQFIGQIYSESQRLMALVDDIIRLSRLDEGAEGLPREPVDLLELAQDVAAQLAPYAEKNNVTISAQGEPCQITGIRPLLRELIYNLCDNAVKYNVPGGRVEMALRQEDGQAVLTVRDTGIGIPPEHQSRVFERFYRVDKSHSKESGGTGLGLSIVKHAAQLHNAQLTLTSAEAQGTTITLRFPK